MINEVTMPSMGADMTEGTIAKWLKAEGDQISRGDKIAEIETDKTVVEMEAYAEGVLRQITVEEGSLVQVGTVIAYIGDLEDEIPEVVSAPVKEKSDTQTPDPVTGQSDVAMDHPAAMRVTKTLCRLENFIEGLFRCQRAMVLDHLVKGWAIHVFHHQE